MGSFSSFAVLLLVLFAYGTNAARLYPISQEFNNETSFLVQPRLLQGLSDDTNESGSYIIYRAGHQIQGGEYYGVSVTMDVYDFMLTSNQYSYAGVRISNEGDGAATSLNIIEIGWEISPQDYPGDSRTHLTADWSDDGFRNDCRNANCLVFQPEAGAPTALGDVIEPVSQPKGVKQCITIKIVKDPASGDWLVYYGFNQPTNPVLIGRYTKSSFSGGLADRATIIELNAVVMSLDTGLVPMGSGYRPTNDNTTAASFSNIQIFDKNGQASLLNHNVPVYMDKPNTYIATPVINGQFFYGGPN